MRSSLLFWLCCEQKLYLLKPSWAVFQESAFPAPTSTERFFKGRSCSECVCGDDSHLIWGVMSVCIFRGRVRQGAERVSTVLLQS